MEVDQMLGATNPADHPVGLLGGDKADAEAAADIPNGEDETFSEAAQYTL